MAEPNFLLGYGELLTQDIAAAPSGAPKFMAYGLTEARDRMVPMLEQTASTLDLLPPTACPNDEAVGVLTLHPQFVAKSYFPEQLLSQAGLRAVGSRPRKVKPEKWTRKEDPFAIDSTELFVAGPRSNFRDWAAALKNWTEETFGAKDLPKVEDFHAPTIAERLRPVPPDIKHPLLEVVLHAGPDADYILDAFRKYAKDLGAKPDIDHRIYAAGLCFLPLRAPREALNELARFSFLRIARPMPRLRVLDPALRSWDGPSPFPVTLPKDGPVDPGLHAAVFDGGLPQGSGLGTWTTSHDAGDVGSPVAVGTDHGVSVTSALLFGNLDRDSELQRPYAHVEHYRVLDETSGQNEDLYDVLHRVRDVLQADKFSFVNLSIGPEIPIEDDDVHGWTATLDELLSDGATLATFAVGNGGELDETLGYNRVQVPGDSVNALCVGAANSRSDQWSRASYSSVGPGRSPGLVKPDILAFGGSLDEPFWTLSPDNLGESLHCRGTSFASPLTLRLGLGIRAHFGDLLRPLAIRALLIHCADDEGRERHEVGWGRIPDELDPYVICSEGTARIVYQGELTPKQYLRAPIPVPEGELEGNVTIRATFCFATKTDSHHPGNYTRSGLDIVFRPHDETFDPKSDNPVHPKSEWFFQRKAFSTEQELRHDAHKWETVLHKERTKRGSKLRNPAFDVHYNVRDGAGPTNSGEKIPYALVITVTSKKTKDLYDRIVRRYPTKIRPLTPVVQIPIRT